MDDRLRVAAVIPAYNEEDNIADAVLDIAQQSYPPDLIVVVNDRSTDGTLDVLEKLADRIPYLRVLTTPKQALRAGAVNIGINSLSIDEIDVVLVSDADSRFNNHLIRETVKWFERFENVGGVCSTAGVLEPSILTEKTGTFFQRLQAWVMWRIERLTRSNFDAERTATWQNVMILHGLCTALRLEAVIEVGGYTDNHLLEDYDLTLRLKRAGWRTMFNPKMHAWTHVPITLKSCLKQRMRWVRGGLDILKDSGIDRHTFEDAMNHITFILLFMGIFLMTTSSLLTESWRLSLSFRLIPITLVILSYFFSLYKLKYVDNLDILDVLIRVMVIPELLMALLMSCVQIVSYYKFLFNRHQSW